MEDITSHNVVEETHGLRGRAALVVLVGEGGQQVLAAVVLVAVDHDLPQRVRP